MTRYQRLTVATAVLTLVLIAIGALVRTTGSGLGCPDWPLCHGRPYPPLEQTAIIEYSHRSAAAIVSVLVLAVTAVTLRAHRADRALARLSVLALLLLLVQAWLGAITVQRELPSEVVSIHMANALLLLAVLSVIAALAFLGPQRRRIVTTDRAGLRRALGIAAVAAFVVVLGGSYLVGAHATNACLTWPGCAQAPIPFVDGSRLQHIHWAHRMSVLVGLVALGWAFMAVQTALGVGSMLRRAVHSALGLYAVQIIVGASNIWTGFSAAARVTHLAVGAAIWALLAVTWFASAYSPVADAQPRTAPSGGREPARV